MFSFITFLIMPRLSEHELSGAVGMLQAACVFLTSRDIIKLIAPQRSLPDYWDSFKRSTHVQVWSAKNDDRRQDGN